MKKLLIMGVLLVAFTTARAGDIEFPGDDPPPPPAVESTGDIEFPGLTDLSVDVLTFILSLF